VSGAIEGDLNRRLHLSPTLRRRWIRETFRTKSYDVRVTVNVRFFDSE
jgi:hypothetical protein